LIRRNPGATLGLTAIVQTIYGICGAFISWREISAAHDLSVSITTTPTNEQAARAIGHFFASFAPYVGLQFVLVFLFQAALTGMLTGAIGHGLLGHKISIAEAWRLARVFAVLGVTVLVALILVLIWVPFVGIVIGLAAANAGQGLVAFGILGGLAMLAVTIFLWIRLSLALPAVVLEGIGPIDALRRSWQLVKSSWWRVFGITLLAGIVVAIIGFILQFPFTIVSGLTGGGGSGFTMIGAGSTTATTTAAPTILGVAITAIGSIIAATCTRPISAGVTVLLYTDMRVRREGLDLALNQAAQAHALTGDEFRRLWRPGQPPWVQR
jgi:hypothetical protein